MAEALKKTFSIKGLVGLFLAIIIIVAMFFITGNEELSREAILAMCVMAVAIVLWCCETFPAGIVGLLAVALAIIFGVTDMSSAWSGFAMSTTIFLIGIFSLTILMTKTNLGQRLTGRLISWAGANTTKVTLAFMIGTALISTVMTNSGATLIGISLALPFLTALRQNPGTSRLGKCLMIGIPTSSTVGGFMTPVGHSLNVLSNGMLFQQTGTQVDFFSWMIMGVPVAIVTIPVALFFLIKIFKPEKLDKKELDAVLESTANLGKFSMMEKKALTMLLLIPALWILGNWIPILNATTVIVIGVVVMFLPGVNLLKWEDMQSGVPWNIVIMVACILSLGNILSASGATDFMANLFLTSGILNLHPLLGLLLVAVIVYLLHTIMPAAPALISIFLPILFVFASAVNISPAIVMLIITLMVANSFILPLNPTVSISYAKGYFTFGDYAKFGAIPSIIIIGFATVWIYYVGGAIGI